MSKRESKYKGMGSPEQAQEWLERIESGDQSARIWGSAAVRSLCLCVEYWSKRTAKAEIRVNELTMPLSKTAKYWRDKYLDSMSLIEPEE